MLPLSSGRPVRAADWAIAFLALTLFAVPALVLAVGERPSRFGFQMYSGYGEVAATWRDSAGTVHPIDLSDHLANARWEVDWPDALPAALCGRLPGAVSVEVRQQRAEGVASRSVTC